MAAAAVGLTSSLNDRGKGVRKVKQSLYQKNKGFPSTAPPKELSHIIFARNESHDHSQIHMVGESRDRYCAWCLPCCCLKQSLGYVSKEELGTGYWLRVYQKSQDSVQFILIS